MQESTQRFSSRVENYLRYRPHYPAELITILQEKCGLQAGWKIADIGSGTGFSSEPFLKNGNTVYGVEPNGPMRDAAEILLKEYPLFISINGTAEETTLPDACVEMSVAGQAFHWFDRDKAKAEFHRILKPDGWVVLFWNMRSDEKSAFMKAYEQFLFDYVPEYARVRIHQSIGDEALRDFFAPSEMRTRTCENTQVFNFEELKGRLLSSSYSPEPGTPGHEPMVNALTQLFEHYQQDGVIRFDYETQVYIGR